MTAAGWAAFMIVGVASGLLVACVRLSSPADAGGWLASIVSALIGAYLGGVYLGTWGWMLGGLNVIGSLTAAVLLAYQVEAFGGRALRKA